MSQQKKTKNTNRGRDTWENMGPKAKPVENHRSKEWNNSMDVKDPSTIDDTSENLFFTSLGTITTSMLSISHESAIGLGECHFNPIHNNSIYVSLL